MSFCKKETYDIISFVAKYIERVGHFTLFEDYSLSEPLPNLSHICMLNSSPCVIKTRII